MVMFNTPFRGQQELSLLGAEQTTSLLVVMITYEYTDLFWNYARVQKLQLYALPHGCYNEGVFQGEVS